MTYASKAAAAKGRGGALKEKKPWRRRLASPRSYKNTPGRFCDEWSRCETGVRRACSAQAPEMTQANAINLVPLP